MIDIVDRLHKFFSEEYPKITGNEILASEIILIHKSDEEVYPV